MYRFGSWFGVKYRNYNSRYQWKKEIFQGLLNIVGVREAFTINQKNFNWCRGYPHYDKSWDMFVKSYRTCRRNLIQVRSVQHKTIPECKKIIDESQNQEDKEVSGSENEEDVSKSINNMPRLKQKRIQIHPVEPSFNTLLKHVLDKIDQSKAKYVLNESENFPVTDINSNFEEILDSQNSLLFRDPVMDNLLYNQLSKTQKLVKYINMSDIRNKLPCYEVRNQFLDLLANNQVVLVSGSTGCGKSTQLVQYVLDDFVMSRKGSLCNIICIVPRRVCATTLARRISYERCESLGYSIGYQIHLANFLSVQKRGCINVITSGIFLRRLYEQNFLHQFSHIFIDEVHERSTDSDFILALLKLILPKKPELKVVLMSATINENLFSHYMNGAPHLKIDGLIYPVKEYYLEDILKETKFKFRNTKCETEDPAFANKVLPYVKKLEDDCSYPSYVTNELVKPISENINNELITDVIHYIVQNEDNDCILIFVPGLNDILSLMTAIYNKPWYSPGKFMILKMHSILPIEEQQRIFHRTPEDVWKIIISTSILETSVTVAEVKYIIDTGKMKSSSFDVMENASSLESVWISKSSARQRKGRAGRLQEGKCFKLYSRAREESFLDFPVPEFLRANLEQECLRAKGLGMPCVKTFFKHFIDPPKQRTLDVNIKFLKTIGVMDSKENLTHLGKHVSTLPVSCRLGKLLVMGAIFSCFDPISSIVACLESKNIFSCPPEKKNELLRNIKRLAGNDTSDHLLYARVMSLWDSSYDKNEFCYHNMLSVKALEDVSSEKENYAKYLRSMNLLPENTSKHQSSNINSENKQLIRALLCAAFYPNVACVYSDKKKKSLLHGPNSNLILFHSKSVCSSTNNFKTPVFVYSHAAISETLFIHDATMINILPLILFCEDITILKKKNKRLTCIVIIDNIIQIEMPCEIIFMLKNLKNHLKWILDRSCQDSEILKALRSDILPDIVKLLSSEALQVYK